MHQCTGQEVTCFCGYIVCYMYTHSHTCMHAVGCYFHGTRTEVAEHKRDCSFKDETQLLAIAMKEVNLGLKVSSSLSTFKSLHHLCVVLPHRFLTISYMSCQHYTCTWSPIIVVQTGGVIYILVPVFCYKDEGGEVIQ